MTSMFTERFAERTIAAIDALKTDPLLAAERDMRRQAEAAIEHLIATGARILLDEPWRVARIVRGADTMDFGDLCTEVARRLDMPPHPDFNRVVALKQLARSLHDERFVEAWEAHRATYEALAREIGQ